MTSTRPRGGLRPSVIFVGLLLSTGSCSTGGTDRSSEPATTRRDSAGITITESAVPAWTPTGHWRVDSVPELIVGASVSLALRGASDAPPGDNDSVLFQRVRMILVRDDGSFVVADDGTKQLMVFDRTGTLVDRFGGQGGGPGELTAILGVYSCAGDSVVVGDYSDVQVFDKAGRFARRARYRSEGSRNVLRGVSADCDRLLVQQSVEAPPLGRIGSATDRFIWFDPLSGRGDTVATVRLVDVWTRTLYGAQQTFMLPWSPSPLNYALRNDTLVTGYGREAEIRMHDASGVLRSIVRWRFESNPVTAADRRQYSDSRREWIARMPVDPETQYLFPELDEYPGLSGYKSLFDRVLTDAEGDLWVRRFPDGSFGTFDLRLQERPWPPESWLVFDSAGVWLGEVKFPDRFELKAVAGGRAYGVARDGMDVETVRVLRIMMGE